MKLLWKLLRHHISIARFAGFSLASIIGLVIVFASIQFYCDVAPLFSGKDSLAGKEFIVISKDVDTFRSLSDGVESFCRQEIDDIRAQDFVSDVGCFTASSFEVYARIGLRQDGLAMSTDLFFESVPDKFVDVENNRWEYTPGSRMIPIVLPRNYLDLYNFGFAQARNLPQLSEELISMLGINVEISGNGKEDAYQGVIVGFSDRLNTILVPESFMEYANKEYGKGNDTGVSRLIVELDKPADERVAAYFSGKGYSVSGNGDANSKMKFFLRVAVGAVAFVGLVITLLAFYILVLSIYLLIEKNIEKLRNLLLIGYSPMTVSVPYIVLVCMVNLISVVLAVPAALFLRSIYTGLLAPLFTDVAGEAVVWIPAVVLFVLLTLMNSAVILCKIYRIRA